MGPAPHPARGAFPKRLSFREFVKIESRAFQRTSQHLFYLFRRLASLLRDRAVNRRLELSREWNPRASSPRPGCLTAVRDRGEGARLAEEKDDAATMAPGPAGRRLGRGPLGRLDGSRSSSANGPKPPLLLSLLLLPAQLLAIDGSKVAGAGRRAVPAAARVHGLPAVPGTALAL